MSSRGQVLLVNPTITSRKRARFPLSLLYLASALENQHDSTLIDGNIARDTSSAVCNALRTAKYSAVGITVMGGPQVATAIEVSRAIRNQNPDLPIVWGGYFPTLYPDVALSSDYVDFVVHGQGEDTFAELLDSITAGDDGSVSGINGLSWRAADRTISNPVRPVSERRVAPHIPYEKLGDPRAYLVRTFLGNRTAAHQAALGCRFRCTFCGVAAMFEGTTVLPAVERLDQDLMYLRNEIGADSIQFYDHNFFDREAEMVPILEVLSQHRMPWWCYARSDALVNLSEKSWELVKKSQLRMAYIGAETPNDTQLKSIRKGTRAEQTLEVARICREHGIIPELSFMVAPPENTEEETELTFEFIRKIKLINPDAEIIVYVDTPLPPACVPRSERLELAPLLDIYGSPVEFPRTPEEWTRPQWVDYACHADAPWLTDRVRNRIRDFVTVLRCRYPTVQDTRSPRWAKATLRGLASWRYALRRYDRPWELDLSNRLIGLLDPRVSSI